MLCSGIPPNVPLSLVFSWHEHSSIHVHVLYMCMCFMCKLRKYKLLMGYSMVINIGNAKRFVDTWPSVKCSKVIPNESEEQEPSLTRKQYIG